MVAAFDVTPQVDSGHLCGQCGQMITLMEEVVLLEVVYINKTDQVEFYAAEDDHGNYAYEPYFFHHSCWEDDVENVLCEYMDQEELSPVLDGRGIAECDTCTSDILPWETSGVLQLGEFQLSDKNPDGTHRVKFVQYDSQRNRPICIACLNTINEEILEMWEGGVTHQGACEEGVQSRCWRTGGCDDPGKPGCRFLR